MAVITRSGKARYIATANGGMTNTTNETSLIGSGVGTLTIPANSFAVGDTIRITLKGIYGSKASGAGTLTVACKLNSTSLASGSGDINDNETNNQWALHMLVTVRSIGATGSVYAQGYAMYKYTQGTAQTMMWPFNVTSATTIDTTAAQVLDITGAWGTADAANTISCTNAIVEYIN